MNFLLSINKTHIIKDSLNISAHSTQYQRKLISISHKQHNSIASYAQVLYFLYDESHLTLPQTENAKAQENV